MSSDLFLSTARMSLRRLTLDDAPLLCALDSDPEVMRFINGGQPTPLEKIVGEVLPRWLGFYEKYEHYGFFAADDARTGEFLGWFLFRPDANAPEDIEVGYRFKRAVWCQGYATEGTRALIDRGMTEWQIPRVVAHTLIGNANSRRVLERSGLTLMNEFVYAESVLPGWSEEERRAVTYALARRDHVRSAR